MYNPASTFGANASAKMYVHPSAALTFTYVSSGLTQRAVLDGNVQGVVVHTKKNTSSSFFLNLAIADFSFTVFIPVQPHVMKEVFHNEDNKEQS